MLRATVTANNIFFKVFPSGSNMLAVLALTAGEQEPNLDTV
jgi:hypothetical protein